VVGLRQDGEAAVRESLDDPELPERLVAVEPLREDAAGQVAQLLLAAGLGQRGLAHVVVEVEVRVVDPDRTALAQRHERELLPVAGHEVEPALERLCHLGLLGRVALEQQDGRHVHVRAVVLQVEERSI
jgi:hypothetical protein